MGHSAHTMKNGLRLWTSGGLSGIFIESIDGTIIEIDEGLLLMLAADHIRSEKISQLEQSTDTDMLGFKVPDYKEKTNR